MPVTALHAVHVCPELRTPTPSRHPLFQVQTSDLASRIPAWPCSSPNLEATPLVLGDPPSITASTRLPSLRWAPRLASQRGSGSPAHQAADAGSPQQVPSAGCPPSPEPSRGFSWTQAPLAPSLSEDTEPLGGVATDHLSLCLKTGTSTQVLSPAFSRKHRPKASARLATDRLTA